MLNAEALLSTEQNLFSMEDEYAAFGRLNSQPSSLSAAGQYYDTNMPILDADRTLGGMLKSKCVSIGGGLGGNFDHFPLVSFGDTNEDIDKAFDIKVSTVYSPKKSSNERRMSCLGLLSSSFFDEHSKVARRGSMTSMGTFVSGHTKSGRRGSMTSVGTFASAGMVPPAQEDDETSMISEIGNDQGKHHPPPPPPPASVPFAGELLPDLESKQVIEAFTVAMTQSHKSQQAIHAWDKKMGLKRSHSKTMRLSMRSRKKLKSMIKKGIHQTKGRMV